MSNTRCTHFSEGSVHTAPMSEKTSSSASFPRRSRTRERSAAWSIPATVRMSTPTLASSGTMFTPCPPSNVPTFMVGPPITGCAFTEIEALQLAHRLRRLVDRVDAQLGHRAVRRDSAEFRVEFKRTLVADERIVGGRLAHDHRARAAEEARAGKVLRSDAAALFRRGENDHDARRPLQALRSVVRGEQDRGHAGLHVGGAAAVEAVAVRLACE